MPVSNKESVRREVIAEIDIASSVRLRVTVCPSDGGRLIDVRECSLISVTSGVFMPTGRGFALSPGAAQALVKALQAALAEIAGPNLRDGRTCP